MKRLLYKCGHCGNDVYRLYQDSELGLITECQKCKTLSGIDVIPARVTVNWIERQEGVMCIFDKE